MSWSARFIGFFTFLILTGWLGYAPTGWAYTRSLLDTSSETVENLDSNWLTAEAQTPLSTDAAVPLAPKKSGLSTGVAAGLAMGPGLLVHGVGHMYAGRPLTGVALLLAEAGGLYMAYRGGTDVSSAVGAIDGSTFSNFHGDSGQISRGLGLAAGGLMIFLSSWLYDVTGSPIAVEQYNQEIKKSSLDANSPVVTSRVTPQGFEVAIERHF
jgi:TM2 domain-containing membrane protein YozV